MKLLKCEAEKIWKRSRFWEFNKVQLLNNMISSMKKLSFQREKLLLQSKSRQKLSSLQLLFLCIAAYDKNRNKSNYEAWQAFFNVAKMNQIESVMQKILYVEVFRTSNSAKWSVLRFRRILSDFMFDKFDDEIWNDFLF